MRRVAGGNARERAEGVLPHPYSPLIGPPPLGYPGHPSPSPTHPPPSIAPLRPRRPPPLAPLSSFTSSSFSRRCRCSPRHPPHPPPLQPSAPILLLFRSHLLAGSLLLLLVHATSPCPSAHVRTPASFSMHRKTGAEAGRGDSRISTGYGELHRRRGSTSLYSQHLRCRGTPFCPLHFQNSERASPTDAGTRPIGI